MNTPGKRRFLESFKSKFKNQNDEGLVGDTGEGKTLINSELYQKIIETVRSMNETNSDISIEKLIEILVINIEDLLEAQLRSGKIEDKETNIYIYFQENFIDFYELKKTDSATISFNYNISKYTDFEIIINNLIKRTDRADLIRETKKINNIQKEENIFLKLNKLKQILINKDKLQNNLNNYLLESTCNNIEFLLKLKTDNKNFNKSGLGGPTLKPEKQKIYDKKRRIQKTTNYKIRIRKIKIILQKFTRLYYKKC